MADSIFEGTGGTPAGANTEIQYNNSGAFGASSDLVFDNTAKTFKVMSSANNLLLVDAATGDYGLGDLDGIGNSTRLFIDDTTKAASIAAGGDRMRLDIDGTAFTGKLGDTGAVGNSTLLTIDDATANKKIRLALGTHSYLQLQNGGIGLDNIEINGGSTVGSILMANDDNIIAFINNSNTWFYLDYPNKQFSLGDVSGGSNSTKIVVDDNAKTVTINNRFETDKGADVAAANNLTLGAGGNLFVITGNTQINAITTANRQAGSMITLIFTGTPTVKHNTAGGAGTAVLLLAGSVDLTAAANTVLGLIYDGTQRQQTFVKVA